MNQGLGAPFFAYSEIFSFILITVCHNGLINKLFVVFKQELRSMNSGLKAKCQPLIDGENRILHIPSTVINPSFCCCC